MRGSEPRRRAAKAWPSSWTSTETPTITTHRTVKLRGAPLPNVNRAGIRKNDQPTVIGNPNSENRIPGAFSSARPNMVS